MHNVRPDPLTSDLMTVAGQFGIQTGAYYGEVFARAMKSDAQFRAKFVLSANDNINALHLTTGRIRGFFVDSLVLSDRLRRDRNYSSFKSGHFILYDNPVYFGLSKQAFSEQRLLEIEAVFDRLNKRGVFNAIKARYLLPEASEP